MPLSVPCCVAHAEEPDKFDKDFNDSESEEDDDGDQIETALRKNERAVKVRGERSCCCSPIKSHYSSPWSQKGLQSLWIGRIPQGKIGASQNVVHLHWYIIAEASRTSPKIYHTYKYKYINK